MIIVVLSPFNIFAIVITHPILWMRKTEGKITYILKSTKFRERL